MSNSFFSVICLVVMLVNAFLSAFSQILLKQSANKEHKRAIDEYLNVRVIAAYVILAYTLVSNAFAYQGIAYKYGSVIGASSYIFLMILSKLILKEKITKKVLLGNLIIMFGMFIYSSNLF